ncbi:MAG: TRAP transporter substrate-binding protein [Kiritimatiellaeota bacterium]|nr:TRAP transporter substrate-binding protein [Kiritimatiellota bacterium]
MKLRKSRALFHILASALLIMLAGCGSKDNTVIRLNYANFPPAPTFPCVQMERWKAEVEARTDGRVKISTFPGSSLLAAKDIFDGVINGHADIGNFAMSYQPGRFPVTEAVDLPHFFPDSKTATKTIAALVKEMKPAEFKDVEVLAVFTCPPAVVMSSVKVDSLDAMKRLTLRSSGTGKDVLEAIGATPVAMPQSDVPDALQKNVVRGNVSSAEVLKDMDYATYCPFVFKADFPVVSFAVVMNKAKFNALPDDIKTMFRKLYDEHSAWTAEYVDQHADDAIAWAKAERKLELYEPSDDDKARLRTAAEPLFGEYEKRVSAKGVDGAAVLEFIRSR